MTRFVLASLALTIGLALACSPSSPSREPDCKRDDKRCEESSGASHVYPWWMFWSSRPSSPAVPAASHAVAAAPSHAPAPAPAPRKSAAPAKAVPTSPTVYKTYRPIAPRAPIYRSTPRVGFRR